MERLTRAARWVSDRLTGAGALVFALVLALLAIVGNLTLARDLLGVQVSTNVLVGIGLVLLLLNVLYRANRRATRAEAERDELRAQLDARPDPAAEGRMFLRLHDEGNTVLAYFHAVLEALPDTMPQGREHYRDWIRRCTEAIEAYRPSYALRFRQAQEVRRTSGGFMVVPDEASGKDRHVSMGEITYYEDLVRGAREVLAEIVSSTR